MTNLRILPLLLAAVAIGAADDAATLYKGKVQPLLAERCYDCHGEKKQKHNLRLDTPEGILKGGKELGPAVIAGKPDESPMVKLCSLPAGEEQAMPPKGPRLTAEQIALLKEWISAGAAMDAAKKP